MVVTGPVQSGKSSYIKYLDNSCMNVEAKSADNLYYTVAMDLGNVKINKYKISLFGTPGLLRFGVMRDVISSGADGIIFVFDSTAPEKDDDAIQILNSVRKLIKPNTPILFLANKQDLEDARSPEVIKAQNKLPKKCKIFATSSKTGLNVEESLNYIVQEVLDNYKELIPVLRDFEEDIRGLASKLKKNKDQMRDFLNNLELRGFISIDRKNKVYKVII